MCNIIQIRPCHHHCVMSGHFLGLRSCQHILYYMIIEMSISATILRFLHWHWLVVTMVWFVRCDPGWRNIRWRSRCDQNKDSNMARFSQRWYTVSHYHTGVDMLTCYVDMYTIYLILTYHFSISCSTLQLSLFDFLVCDSIYTQFLTSECGLARKWSKFTLKSCLGQV